MDARDILFGDDARRRIASGINTLADAVKVTLGPRGRTVLIDRSRGSPTVTKDGVTVAKEVELEDHFANLGAQMVKEVAARTSELAGDGTTTATVLAQAIFSEGARLVSAGVNPMELKRGIDAAVQIVVAELKKHARVTHGRADLARVATISANGDAAIGELIAEAMEKVGPEGVITLEEAKVMETSLEVVEGMEFNRGYLSPYFVTNPERMEVVLTDAYILIHEAKLSNLKDLVPILEAVAKEGRPLLIIAESVEGEALTTLVVNKLRGTLQVCAVKPPGFGDKRKDLLRDLAVLTGAQLVSEELGLKLALVTLKDLGRARQVTVDRDSTIFLKGAGTPEVVAARVTEVKHVLEKATSEYDRENLRARLAKLSGGVGVIAIGAATELELKERKDRFDDALHAARAAVEEGVVPGGGVALLRTLPALERVKLPGEQQYGVTLIRRAIEEPLRQMAQNGGWEGSVVVARVIEETGHFGFNVATGRYEDLIHAGVLDPTRVVRIALQNAASIASLMLTTEALIAEHSSAKQVPSLDLRS